MIHYLTIGLLDPSMVPKRVISARAPLPPKVLALLDEYLDAGSQAPQMAGKDVTITNESIRCPWYTPQHVRAAERFAAAAVKLGCTVADIEHGRIIDVAGFLD